MTPLPEMPKHTLSLASFFDDTITTPRLKISLLEKHCASEILKALKKTNGFQASNNEFIYYSDEAWHNIQGTVENKHEGLKFIWQTLLPDIKSKRPETLFLGLFSEQEQQLVGMLAVWFDKRKWLRISPFIFPEHQKNYYAKEAYESIGESLGNQFSNGVIYAVISPGNDKSIALFQSLGFEEVVPSPANVDVPHLRKDIMSLGSKRAYGKNFSLT